MIIWAIFYHGYVEIELWSKNQTVRIVKGIFTIQVLLLPHRGDPAEYHYLKKGFLRLLSLSGF